MKNDFVKIRGEVILGGEKRHNLVVYGGYDSLCSITASIAAGDAGDIEERFSVRVCSGDVDAPTRSDTTLQGTQQAKVTITTASVDTDEHSVTMGYTIPAGTVSGTTYITEAGLYFGDTMFSRVVFSDPIEVSSTTELEGTWKIIYGDDSVPTGTGTSDDPYLIANTTQMDWFASQVNGGETSICAALIANITYNAGEDVAGYDGKSNVKWDTQTPICTASSGYKGTFDGRGNTISGLYINTGDYTRAGLFGYVGSGGVVKDVIINNAYVASSYVGASEVRVGGIAGEVLSGGVISGCTYGGKADITADCSGSDVETTIRCGGLVGYNGGTASECTMSGSVDVSGTATASINCGGLMGINSGSVSDCTMSGSVDVSGEAGSEIRSGGLTGINNGSASECTMSGSVNVSGEAGSEIRSGGLTGINNGSASMSGCTMSGSVDVSGTATASINCGGLVGYNNSSASMSGCTMSGSVDVSGTTTASIYCGGLTGINSGSVSDCTMSGSVDVSGTTTASINCGGLVGYNNSSAYVYSNSLYGSYSITGTAGTTATAAAIIAGGTTSSEYIYDNYDYTTEAAVAAASVSAE